MEKEIKEAVSRLHRIEAELGEPSEEPTKSDDDQEEPFEYSKRIILSDIQELKGLIAMRDKESLVCTNRRKVIELNAKIYREMKRVMEIYNQAHDGLQKEINSRRGKKKLPEKEIERREEALTIILAQLKQLQSKADENHATDRFIEANGSDHLLPILTVLPHSPLSYDNDRLDVKEAIEYAEDELTEKQKASLQIYEKNKQSIDRILDAMSEGLTELKNHADMMGNEIEKQNQILQELDTVVDGTTEHIRRNRETLQRHSKKHSNKNCGMYMCCTIMILIVVIVILNLLRSAFT